MKRAQREGTAHLMEDIGVLGFLLCIFFIILLGFLAEGEEKTECILMFLILCAPMLFCVYRMPLAAYTLAGVQILGYAVYKLYRWSLWSESITLVSFAWIGLPVLAIATLQLFMQGVTRLERKNKLLQEQVEELVVIDPLTGLYNRRGLYNELTRQMAHSRRNGEKIALMEIQLKYAQELRGILSARQFNQLRQRMAEIIENLLRIEDRLYAVDENGTLVLLLLNCDQAGAAVVERRLRTALLERDAFHGIAERTIKVEAKIGYVEYDQESTQTAMEFLNRAESELQYDV